MNEARYSPPDPRVPRARRGAVRSATRTSAKARYEHLLKLIEMYEK